MPAVSADSSKRHLSAGTPLESKPLSARRQRGQTINAPPCAPPETGRGGKKKGQNRERDWKSNDVTGCVLQTHLNKLAKLMFHFSYICCLPPPRASSKVKRVSVRVVRVAQSIIPSRQAASVFSASRLSRKFLYEIKPHSFASWFQLNADILHSFFFVLKRVGGTSDRCSSRIELFLRR